MTRFRQFLVAGLSSAILMASGSAHAIFRAYLSTSGSDANPCTLPQPCRLLPAALAAVDAGGEIWMLDSANYNTTTVGITKSVTILAVPGVVGSVLGNGGTALSISGAGIDVTLQNLVIRSSNGDIGVLIANAGTVNVIGSTILGFRGFFNDGVGIWSNTGTNATKVNIVGTILRNNHHGIVVAGNGRATISKSNVLGNGGVGVWSNSGTGIAVVHVSDTVSSGNAHGFVASGSSGAYNSYMFVTRSVATENANAGFLTDGGITAFMVVGESMSTNNASGFNNNGGNLTFHSRGNNTVTANVADIVGTITPHGGV
ncbi:MAG: right-handed parallel beta-helix repeat-containing protein [Burkholderiales bacterium]|nr:right-handed parallel beta-helix repeat-containing protein [Burkholderiales bacterium]